MDDPPFSVFMTVLGYIVFIVASPVITFFTVKCGVFEGIFGVSTVSSNVWSAVSAVIMLHIAVGLYLYKAYFETEQVKTKPSEKTD